MTSSPPVDLMHKPYWCFISYRQIDNKILGRQWATWLHQQIETYEVPADLVGTTNQRGETIPTRIFPVFRDEDELSAVADLDKPIYQALERSLFMLVLCTPRAVASRYVADEITYFKTLGKSDRVLAALVDGEPKASWDLKMQAVGILPDRECFPEPLQHEVNSSGQLDKSRRIEPIAADFRLPDGSEGWTSPEAYRDQLERADKLSRREIDIEVQRYLQQCKTAKLKIISGILGVDLGSLTKRDRAYQLEKEIARSRIFRRVAIVMGVLTLLAAGAGVLAYFNQRRAERGEADAKKNLEHANSLLWQDSYSSWNEAERSRASGHPQNALAYLAKGMESTPENKGLATFAYSLMTSEMLPWRTILADYPIDGVTFDPSGEHLIVAERVYENSVRYSLWQLREMERSAQVEVGIDGVVTKDLVASSPWLKDAPKLNKQTEDSYDPTFQVPGPGAFQKVVFGISEPDGSTPDKDATEETPEEASEDNMDDGESASGDPSTIRIAPDPLAGGFLGSLPELVFPDSHHHGYSKAVWNRDGTRVALVAGMAHSHAKELERGEIVIWDLRRPDGALFVPEKTVSFGEGAEPSMIEKQGPYELWEDGDGGYQIRRSGQSAVLWKPKSEVELNPSQKRALTVQVLSEEGELQLEWRDIETGSLVSDTTVKMPAYDKDSTLIIGMHPSISAAALLQDETLVAWTDEESEPKVMPLPCPKDEIGWASAVAFSPDGATLFLGTKRRLLALSWPGLNLLAGPVYHDSIVSNIAISADGKKLLSSSGFTDGGGSTGYGQLWKLPELQAEGPRFRHDEQMSGVDFTEEGALIYTASESPEGASVRFWESKTSLPVSAYLKGPDMTGQTFLSFESFTPGEISSVRMKGQVDAWGEGTYLTQLPRPITGIPEWFYKHFLPFICCKRVGKEGAMEDLKPEELAAHFKALELVRSGSEDGIYHQVLRWYLANPSTRTTSPWSNISLDDYIEAKVFRASREQKEYHGGLGHAYRLDPSHPLLHLHIALKSEHLSLRKRLIAHGLQLLKLESNAQTYGKERWKAQLLTGKEILGKLKSDPKDLEDLQRLIDKL